ERHDDLLGLTGFYAKKCPFHTLDLKAMGENTLVDDKDPGGSRDNAGNRGLQGKLSRVELDDMVGFRSTGRPGQQQREDKYERHKAAIPKAAHVISFAHASPTSV
ncbi:hypothetical protein ACFLQ0_01725, partial [Nitrospinota bacterium]